ncbi:MAG: hypothetical protein Ct9H90mP26_1980 [Methanobacteriota archaeon]|nr:MAG: hypothetical protein Ct9H90mP26_1980 [Euryarchaeota archaeon]
MRCLKHSIRCCKIISWAPDRERAIARLDSALEETILLGVDSLIPLHRAILIDEDFMERKITTDYLETHADLLSGWLVGLG